MAENEVFYYGFILFCNPKTPEKTPFIGSKVSASVKYKGNVKFTVDQLNIKNYQPGKYFYMIKYTLIPGKIDRVEHMELVTAFEKNQYPGTLSVDGLGTVYYTKAGNNDTVVISGSNSGDVAVAPVVPEAPRVVKGNTFVPNQVMSNNVATAVSELELIKGHETPELEWKINENGHEVVSFYVPYELIYGEEYQSEYKFGIVNYFVTSISTYVRERFTNHLYCHEENGAEIGIFKSQEDAPVIEKVGRINTGKFLYFVLFKETGENVENPMATDSTLPKVTDVHFMWKLPHKKVEKIIPDENGVRISMIVKGLMNAVVKEADMDLISSGEPAQGQSVESYLNKLITAALQAGEVNRALEILENHKADISYRQYLNLRYRLLPRLYKDTKSDESRLANIECIDALLPFEADPSRINFRMTLLLEKANKHLQGQETEPAEIALKEWLQHYSALIENSPELEKGLRLSHTKVLKGLKICAGEELGDFDVISDEAAEEEYSVEGIIDDPFILETMSSHSCAVFGKDYEIFDDLSNLSDEDDHGLRRFLDEHSDEENIKNVKELWAIAKIYWMLQASPVEILDEDDAAEKRDRFIVKALKEEAIARAIPNDRRAELRRMNQVNWGELTSLFYMDKLMSMKVNETRLATALGAFCFSSSNLVRVMDGEVDLKTVLRVGQAQNSLEIMTKALAMLCAKNKDIKELFKDIMMDEVDVEGSILGCMVKKLNELGGTEDNGLEVALESAIKDYDRFCKELALLSNPSSVSDVGKDAMAFIDEPCNIRWLEQDVVYVSSLKDCFKSLRDYDKATNFSQKAGYVTKSMENMHKVTDNIIQSHPSILSYTLLNPLLEKVNEKLIYAYKKLCQSTRPTIKIGACEAVDTDGENVTLNIPVTIEKGIAQDATNVVLFVKDDKGEFTCEVKRYPLGSSIPSDGRTIHTSVAVKLKKESLSDITIRVRAQFDYIRDVTIETERARFGDRRRRLGRHFVERHRSRDVKDTIYLPGLDEGGWVAQDVNLKQNMNKREISTERIKKFPSDGQLDFKDPDIQKILENRRKQIDDVIDSVTMIVKDENGNDRRVLTNMGRWAILYGQWRVGKSVILNCVHDKLDNREDYPHAVVIHLELSGSDQPEFENFFARKIFLALNLALDDHEDGDEYFEILEKIRKKYELSPTAKDIDWETMVMFMAEFNSGIRKLHPEAATVLLVDEFTEIYQAIIKGNVGEKFPSRWTSFINTAKLLCVTAGGEHTVSLMETYAPNTLQKATSKIPVRYLSEADVDIYVHYVLGESKEDQVPKSDSYFASNSDEAVKRIYNLTGGNAYLLMNLCTWIIDYMNYCKEQGLVRNLTTNLVNEAIAYFINNPNMAAKKLEAHLFNSLYNPFNEADEGQNVKDDIKRIEDDQVCKVNLEILEAIVRYADTINHKCAYSDLTTKIFEGEPGNFDKVYKKAYDTLLNRGILCEDTNGNVWVFIDLFYEIVNGLARSASDFK